MKEEIIQGGFVNDGTGDLLNEFLFAQSKMYVGNIYLDKVFLGLQIMTLNLFHCQKWVDVVEQGAKMTVFKNTVIFPYLQGLSSKNPLWMPVIMQYRTLIKLNL